MSKLTRVVIVPGFAESHLHFKPLQNSLKQAGFTTSIVKTWQSNKLEESRGKAVFIGHSVGAYHLALNGLAPSLLIGLPDKMKVKKSFFKSIRVIYSYSQRFHYRRQHAYNRLVNVATFLRHPVAFVKIAYYFNKSNRSPVTNQANIILLQNDLDPMVKHVAHGVKTSGHHDDILYNPEAYITYVEELSRGSNG